LSQSVFQQHQADFKAQTKEVPMSRRLWPLLVILILMTSALIGGSGTVEAAPASEPPAQTEPDPAEEESTGLDTLGETIGTLGLFAAIMAVLALGTEVTIDVLKFVVGLKRKPTALGALDQLGDKLPGQLRDLGLSNKTISDFENLTEDMKEILAPVTLSAETLQAVKDGDFGTAIEKAEALVQAAGGDTEKLKKALVQELDEGMQALIGKLSVPPGIATQIKTRLLEEAQAFDTANAVDQAVSLLQNQAPALCKAWMDGQIITLTEQGLEKGRDQVLASFDQELQAPLLSLGLDAATLGTIRGQIEWTLENLSSAAVDQLYHLDAMWELLKGVELRRFEIQSPLRKLWRRLRRIQFLKIGKGFEWIETQWNRLVGSTPPPGVGLDEPRPLDRLSPSTVARQLLEMENRQKDEESSRVRLLRTISVVVGIYLAFALQVDAVEILSESFTSIGALNVKFAQAVESMRLPLPESLTAGVILSGFAASAGSAYWHDQLERLQIAKKAVSQVSKAVESVKGK
jgi:hypothetical protein